MGVIVRDESYADRARITLEREPRVVPYAITCGVHGWMAHTRYFATEEEAHQAFDDMKLSLERIVNLIPDESDPDADARSMALFSALKTFVDDYPAL